MMLFLGFDNTKNSIGRKFQERDCNGHGGHKQHSRKTWGFGCFSLESNRVMVIYMLGFTYNKFSR